MELELNPVRVGLLSGTSVWRRCLNEITKVVGAWWTCFLSTLRWWRENSHAAGFLSRSRRNFTSVFFLKNFKTFFNALVDESPTHRYFHVDFNGFSFLEPKIQLNFRFRLLFLASFFVLNILEMVLKGNIEVKRVWAILKTTSFVKSLNKQTITYAEPNTNKSTSPVVVLNAQHKVSWAVWNWFNCDT